MQRRNFIKLSSLGLGVSLAPGVTLAKTATDCAAPVAGALYYTKDAPGRWKEKVAGHLPSLNIEKKGNKITVNVVTAHEMKGYEHYIVKHVLLDKDYQFLDERLFNPEKDKAASSSFVLENYKGTLYALSMCNKHDVWLNSASV